MITIWETYRIKTLTDNEDSYHVSGNGLSIHLLGMDIVEICNAISKHIDASDHLGIVTEVFDYIVWTEQVMVSSNLYTVNNFLRYTKSNDVIGIFPIKHPRQLKFFFEEFLATGEYPNAEMGLAMLEFTNEPHLARVKNLAPPQEDGQAIWWFLGQGSKSLVCYLRKGVYVVELTRYFETVKSNYIYYGKKVQTFNFRGYDFEGICELARNCHEKYHEAGGRVEFVLELLNMLGTKR